MLLFSTKSNNPNSQRQFQTGWKQWEGCFIRIHLRREDVSVALVAICWQAISFEGLVTSFCTFVLLVLSLFLSKFNFSLESDENFLSLISNMEKMKTGPKRCLGLSEIV